MNKTLLILGGNAESIPGIHMAKKMGLHVVVCDKNPVAAGVKFADDHLGNDVLQTDEVLQTIEQYHNKVRPINGVLSFSPYASLTVARIAECLTLPGISRASAELIADKLAMKTRLRKDKLRLPWYSAVDDASQLQDIVQSKGFPLLLRPAKQKKAGGVVYISKGVDLAWAFNYTKSHALDDAVLVERFITGQQVSAESLILDGDVFTPGFCDRNYEYLKRFSPYVIENGGNLPSLLPDDVQDKINQQIKKAAHSLGISNGVIKGEFVVHQLKPYILGVTAGLNGGYIGTHLIPISTGVNVVQLVIQQALGETFELKELKPRFTRGVSQRYLFAEPGRIVEISGVDLARDLLCIEEVIVKAKVGDVVNSPVDSNSWVVMVIAVGDNRDQANKHVFDALNHITIKTEPLH